MEKRRNPLLDQPLEVRMVVENWCREDLTTQEILVLFNEKYPWISGITTQHIAFYRKKYVPHFKELLLTRYGKKSEKKTEDLEEEILEQIQEEKTTGEEFSKTEQEKTNILRAKKVILNEMYSNYKNIRSSTDETGKKNYLVEMSKILGDILELEQAERSFSSAMDEVRKTELNMDIVRYFDSITGWFIPRMLGRSSSKEQASEYIIKLHNYLNDFQQIISKSSLMEEALRDLLQHLYASKKVTEDEQS